MEIRPILSSLLRHKTAALLIVLEIALSCAILCNAVFVIGSRIAHMQRDSGVVEDELVFIHVNSHGASADQHYHDDVAILRAIPGVRSVSSVMQVPFGDTAMRVPVSLSPDGSQDEQLTSLFLDDGHLLQTLGVRVLQGRGFGPDDVPAEEGGRGAMSIDLTRGVVLTQTLAERLFPDGDAVGSTFYGLGSATVVGVVEDLLAPGDSRTEADAYSSIITPIRPTAGHYVLRTDPERRQEVLEAAAQALLAAEPNRIISEQKTLEQMREDAYSRDRAVVWLLLAVCIALLGVTAFGIVGLASFWVQQRTKQIGVRRALGATRGRILRYFQVENFLLSTFGIVLGMLLAYGVNQWLMGTYELARLPLYYLPIGGVVLWILGQVAVLGPALRAAAVPPAIATRTA